MHTSLPLHTFVEGPGVAPSLRLCNYPPIKWIPLGTFALAACQPPEVVKTDLCNAPFPPKWEQAAAPCELCNFNAITIKMNGSISWNGVAIDRATIEKYLNSTRQMEPEPVIVLNFARGTPCEPVRWVRQTMDKILECRNGYKCRVGKLEPKPS
jgi:hypothetical protein